MPADDHFPHGLLGWVVDLRDDRGGYLQTRWIGLHPFFVEECLFGQETPDPHGLPRVTGWMSFGGSVFTEALIGEPDVQSESVAMDLGSQRYTLHDSSVPIAVLVGNSTASAREHAALALRQNPRVRLFGRPTFGATTSMDGFELEDGSLLLVGDGFAVRDGRLRRRAAAAGRLRARTATTGRHGPAETGPRGDHGLPAGGPCPRRGSRPSE